MNDTPEEVQNVYRTLLMRRPGSERLQMGCAMFDTARAFASANLRASSHSDDELRVRLFVRTYRGDFDAETVERIRRSTVFHLPEGNADRQGGSFGTRGSGPLRIAMATPQLFLTTAQGTRRFACSAVAVQAII